MGSWYWIGVSVGLGTAAGMLLAAFAGRSRVVLIVVAIAAAGLGAALGYGVETLKAGGWIAWIGGIAGGLAGSLGAAQVVAGALRRGGTRAGTATLLGGVAFLAAGVGFIPVLGYLEALALPALGLRVRRARPERYAGLRTLGRD